MTVRVIKKELTVPKVTQYYYEVKPKNKVEEMCIRDSPYPEAGDIDIIQ